MSGNTTALAVPAPPPQKPKIAGIVAISVWIVVAIAFVVYFVGAFDVSLIDRFGSAYLGGLWVTISLVAMSFVFGAVVSLPVALGRMATNPLARAFAFAFVFALVLPLAAGTFFAGAFFVPAAFFDPAAFFAAVAFSIGFFTALACSMLSFRAAMMSTTGFISSAAVTTSLPSIFA